MMPANPKENQLSSRAKSLLDWVDRVGEKAIEWFQHLLLDRLKRSTDRHKIRPGSYGLEKEISQG